MKNNNDSGNAILVFILEVISVTIGLSLALGIDSYSTYNKDRKLEEYYLREIKNDLDNDCDKIKELIEYNEVRIYHLNKIAFEQITQDSFLKCASYLRTVPIDYESSKPNFDALKNSSYFNIIRNKELLNKIITHYNYLNQFKTQKHDLDEHFNHSVTPYLEANFDLWDFFVMKQADFVPESDIKRIMDDLKFKNLTLTHTEAIHLQNKILNTYLKLSEQLIIDLLTEVKKNFE